MSKYVKRKASHKTDDKIKKALSEIKTSKTGDIDELEIKEEEDDSDVSLSDDELQHDKVRAKEKQKRKKKSEEQEEFFEDVICNDGDNVSFYEMNLSRPLLKAITAMKFVHPTPVQASTIPVALGGKNWHCYIRGLLNFCGR